MSVDPGTMNVIGLVGMGAGLLSTIGALIYNSFRVGKMFGQINVRLDSIDGQHKECTARGDKCRDKRVEVEEDLHARCTNNATGLACLKGRLNSMQGGSQ